MKKILLVVAALALVLSGVNAADVPAALTASVSGNASVQFGYDLDTTVAGIANASEAALVVTLVAETSSEAAGEGDLKAEIKIKDIKFKVDDNVNKDGAAAAIDYAKITYMGAWLSILGNDQEISKAASPVGILGAQTNAAAIFNSADEFDGIELGYSAEKLVSIKVAVSSQADWKKTDAVGAKSEIVFGTGVALTAVAGVTYTEIDGSTAAPAILIAGKPYVKQTAAVAAGGLNTTNNYNVYAALGLLAVDGLTLEAAVGTSTAEKSTVGLGANAAYVITVAEGITVKPYVGYDYVINNVAVTTASDLKLGLLLGLPGDKLADAENFGYAEDTLDLESGLDLTAYLDLSAGKEGVMDFRAAFYNNKLVAPFTTTAVLEYATNVAKVASLGLGVRVAGKIDIVSPYVEYTRKTADLSGTVVSNSVIVGADIAILALTNLNLEYKSGDLTATTPVKGTFITTLKISL